MTFNRSACIPRILYCGDGPVPKDTATKKYSRKGTGYECLKKGYGVAYWEQRKKNLSKTSLQQIMYIGPTYEANFKKQKVYSIISLLKKMENLTSQEKKAIISRACKKKNGAFDQKAFNSVVLFLHNNKIKELPSCKIVSE